MSLIIRLLGEIPSHIERRENFARQGKLLEDVLYES
jgi:hypothetical protein